MRGHSHSQMIWLIVPPEQSTQTEFLLPDQPLMRFSRMTAIESLTADDITHIFPGNIPLISAADLKKVAFTINCNNPESDYNPKKQGRYTETMEAFKYIPLSSMHRIQAGSTTPFVRQLLELRNVYPQWDKCKINVAPGGLGNVAAVAIAFNVYYTWLGDDGRLISQT